MKRTLAKWGVAATAIAASVMFLHWLAVLPPPVGPKEFPVAFFVRILLDSEPQRSPIGFWYLRGSLVLMAITGLLACALSLVIVLRTLPTPATLRLSGSLALASASATYFFFATTHRLYREALGLDAIAGATAGSFIAYAAGILSPYLLMRFFMGYPRAASDEQWAAHFSRLRQAEVDATRSGWRAAFYPKWASLEGRAGPGWKWLHFDLPDSRARARAWLDSPSPVPWLLGLSLLCALGDALGQNRLLWIPNYLVMLLAMLAAYEALQYHRKNAVVEDRSRIDWIYGTILVGGWLFALVAPFWWGLLPFLIPSLEASGIPPPGHILFVGPITLGLQAFILAFVISIALSIFYRGTVDPQLAMRKVTLYGAMGIVVTFLFILLERAVAVKVVEWMKLPPESGALLAGALVASTVAPIRSRAERAVNVLVTRYLPLDSVVQGDRKVAVVALSDLSGYTALSAKDEKEALLLATLLQRQAQRIAEAHGGRVVKSMGDAVMLTFHDAAAAVAALRALHHDFAPAAQLLGLTPLEVHSGAHIGEVTETQDGDLYGQTVNIAARLQGLAKPGQAIVSATLAGSAAIDAGERKALGLQRLKNVPDPVECEELQVA